MELVSEAGVAIVGAGIMGTAIAFNLARLGCSDVVVFDKGTMGGGATGKSVGILRTHYSHQPTVEMALKSLEILERFSSVIGGDAGLHQVGWIMITSGKEREVLREHVGFLRRLGVETDLLSASEIRRLCTGIQVDDTAVGAYEPRGGYADPHSMTSGYAQAARSLGVRIYQETPVLRVQVSNGRVCGVETSHGPVAAKVVVLTTAAWTEALLEPLGIKLPLTLSRHQVLVLRKPQEVQPIRCVVKDLENKTYLKPEVGDTVVAGTVDFHYDPADPDRYADTPTPTYVNDISEKLCRRFPAFRESVLMGGWAGIYDITPDWNPLLGTLQPIGGLFCAVGFNGHGFKLAPATGVCMAELILSGKPSLVDIHAFRPQRFEEGETLEGIYGAGSTA